MLIYHPFQDANHCVFRTLLLLEHSVHDEIDIELYRLLDFYILFPHLLKNISPLPAELRAYKRLIEKIPDPFESMLNTKRIIHELESLQSVALHNLLAKKLIDIDSFKDKKVKRTDEVLPESISVAINEAKNVNEEWFRVIANELPLVNFSGKKGLKMRAGLMEFRYDLEEL
ncbi:MAG: ABC-three component system middle component 5 [Pseudomonadota bacterium]